MSESYTPVFKSILESTVWGEPPHVKVVWLTMLLKKDRDGFVLSTVPGLARAAVVTLEQCEEALAVLLSPDKHSQSDALEGRRIVKIDGGWHVVNHEKYSDLTLKSGRERVRRHREAERVAKFGDPVTLQGVTDSVGINVRSTIDCSPGGAGGKRGNKAGSDCPDSLEPTPATLAVAAETGRNWRADFDAMRDWHLSKGERKVDWQATLRGWMRRANEIHSRGKRNQPPQPNDESNRYIPPTFQGHLK